MPQSRQSLERQLALATAVRDERASQLDDQGVSASDRRRDPQWRNRNATCRSLRQRLAAVEVREARSATAEATTEEA